MIAKTFHGLEGVLAEELQEMGAQNIRKVVRAVTFEGDKRLMYRANLRLRTALRILKPLKKFKALNQNDLYEASASVEWDTYLDPDGLFVVDAIINQARNLNHSQYVAYRIKDAIVDQFRSKYKKRPDVNTDRPDLRISIHLFKTEGTLSLDSTGVSLHKRGYRLEKNEAPLNEVLAAGMLMLAGYDGNQVLFDPMCGSGTIVTEGSMIAKKVYPGVLRQDFAFMKWKDFDKELFEEELAAAKAEERQAPAGLYGSDISPVNLMTTKKNLSRAGISGSVALKAKAFEKRTPPPLKGLIVMNPPYGQRMGNEKVTWLYKAVGERLRDSYKGWTAWIISSNREAMGYLGMKSSQKIELFNGKLPCTFNQYEIFEENSPIPDTNS